MIDEPAFYSLVRSLPGAWMKVALYAAFLGMSAHTIETMLTQVRAAGATPTQAIKALRASAEVVLEGKETQEAAMQSAAPITERPDVGLWS